MRRADVDHLIRAAGAELGEDTIIEIGSQSLLASSALWLRSPAPTVARRPAG